MEQIYKRLFSAYGDSILRNVENFDDLEFRKAMERFPLTEKQRLEMVDVIFDHYYQWSMDAFTLGLHLGLSLLTNTPGRPANGGRLHGSTAPAAAKRKGSPYNNHHRR